MCYIKPNFTEDQGHSLEPGEFYLFVGRVSAEKGIECIIEAFKNNGRPLVIVGTGPLKTALEKATEQHTNIQFKGFQDQKQIQELGTDLKFTVPNS